MNTQQALLDTLIDKMREYVDSERTSANKSNLAHKTGVSRATISKYLQNEITSLPSAVTAFKILRFFDGKNDAALALKGVYPEWWKSTGQDLLDKEISFVEDRKDGSYSFKFEKVHMLIFDQAQLPCGAHDNWIIRKFGTDLGLPARDDLIKGGYIERTGACCFVKDIIAENDIAKAAERMVVECENFPVEDYGVSAVLVKYSEFVSAEARRKSLIVMQDALNKIRAIREEDKEGNFPKTEFLKLNMFGNWSEETGV